MLEHIVPGRDLREVYSVPSYKFSDRILQGQWRLYQVREVFKVLEEARGRVIANARAVASYKPEYCFPDNEAKRDCYQVP